VLAISTLGLVTVEREGAPVTRLETRKAEALLVYLACTGRAHSREVLAEIFWPERPSERALGNLRVALAGLRKHAGEYLLVQRDTLSIDPDANVWLDVRELEARLAAGQIEAALDLYRGDFLEGFYVQDSPDFEGWVMLERERLRRLVHNAMRDQVARDLEVGDYRAGIRHCARLLDLDSLLEEAHRQMMRLLVYDGQRSAALAQYEACQEVLAEELGVEPSDATTRLYQEIQAGELAMPVPSPEPVETRVEPVDLPAYLQEEVQDVARPVFVARQEELTRLEGFLAEALQGRGGVAFVTGGPGRGKTALLNEFAWRAMDRHADLLVAAGNCNAYSGVGDPYLPFRDLMAMLTGDVEARLAAGSISREHARRLWAALPVVLESLVDYGPDVLSLLSRTPGLLSRGTAVAAPGAPWLHKLQELAGRQQPDAAGSEQFHFFEQLARVLRILAEARPLLLVLDDVQWIDSASASLLFHLGRHLEGSRILIVGAYRAEEVVLKRDGRRHPLEKVLREFQRQFGDVWVNLGRLEDRENRQFLEALLDTEPNRLSEGFRDALFQHTAGHPLFTVELLRMMQQRGDLLRDEQGQWMEGTSLDWDSLPPRVEGVIEERIERLEPRSRQLLRLAAVEGERFTVQVLARLAEVKERRAVQRLANDLARRHRLVVEDGTESLGERRRHRYRFGHALFQQYLYSHLSSVERELLHAEVAGALEALYPDQAAQLAVELARHWLLAAEEEHAVPYLVEAGDQARAVYAHAEAEGFYRQAVTILRDRGSPEQAARTLMKLGLVYTAAFEPARANEAYEEAFALWKPLRDPWEEKLQPSPGRTLKFAVEHPPTLDPGMVGDDVSLFLTSQLFEGLVRIGEDYNVLPAAARRWEILDSGTRYIFHLREEMRWSDGRPVTAHDFAYGWKRNLDPETASPVAHLLDPIRNARAFREGEVDDPDRVGVAALDERTVEVRLEGPTAYLPHLLAHPIAYPLPEWVVEREGRDWMAAKDRVTNGAYVLSEWEPGERMVLTRSAHFSRPSAGNVERVECFCPPSYERALEVYAKGEVEVVSLLNADPATVARARVVHGDELVFFPRAITFYLMFRADRSPFDDVRVRRAFIQAVDRDALAREAFSGLRLPATGGFVPPGMAGHSPGIGLAYDVEQARQLVAEAGYPDGRGLPALDWIHMQGSEGERVVSFIRSAWRENLGIDVVVEALAWQALLERMSSEPAHLIMVGWGADYPDPDCMLRVTFHSKTGVSAPGWQNDRFDALVEEAARTTDHTRRMALYQEADRILVAEEAAVMPISYGRGRILVKPWVSLPRTLSVQMSLDQFRIEGR
jgi:ABC-type oligopeptide transport system substrate-binding subunit/DNA-binding SARP family transcriptional activator